MNPNFQAPYKSQITKEGQKIGDYLLTKRLGQGQYGTVWLGKHLKTGEIFAVKKVDRSRIDFNSLLKRLLQTEVSIMHEINHPNIMHLYELLTSSKNYYLVIQHCNQSDLETYMREKRIAFFEERDAVLLFQQIMNGFFELRKRKILHRDFKLANIFVHDEILIIGDFGFAKCGQDIGETRLGSPLTMAPELLFSVGDDIQYNSKADLWSIGIVFYQLLFGVPPFWGKNVAELKKNIVENSGSRFKFPKAISAEARDLLIRLLTLDPVKRIEWRDFFNHDLFRKHARIEDSVEVSGVFGPNALRSIISARKEFERNRVDPNSYRNVTFYGEQEFANLNKSLAEHPVKEEVINKSLDEQLMDERIATEVQFRFCHELNKIFFQIYTARKLQGLLKETLFPIAQTNIMNAAVIVLKRAIMMALQITADLKAGKNALNFHEFAFQTFCESPKRLEVLASCESNIRALANHLNLLSRRCHTNNIPLLYPEVWQNRTDDRSLLKFLSVELGKIKSMDLHAQLDPHSPILRRYYQTMALLNYNLKMSVMFPYIRKENQEFKFNWNGFYYTLERATAAELRLLM
jgi:serine/threonine protein kinase